MRFVEFTIGGKVFHVVPEHVSYLQSRTPDTTHIFFTGGHDIVVEGSLKAVGELLQDRRS